MNDSGLRYNIVTSNVTVIVSLLVAVILWIAAGAGGNATRWLSLFGTVVVAYLLLELNNRNALLRVRSRLISSTYLLLAGAITFLHPLSTEFIPLLCLALAYVEFFACYQDRSSQGHIFHVFLSIGIGALVFPQMLLFAPFFIFSGIVHMRSLTLRAFCAAIIGVALPLLIREVYLLFMHSNSMLHTFWIQLTAFPIPDYSAITESRLVSFTLVVMLGIISIVHFLRTKYDEKIRVRVLFYVMILEEIVTMAFIVAYPKRFDLLFRLLILNSSPLIAHQLAFARGKLGSFYFYVVISLIIMLACYNIAGINFGIWENLRNI